MLHRVIEKNQLSLPLVALLIMFSVLVPMIASAQGDGPRAYFPAPGKTHIFAGIGLFTQGNQSYDSSSVLQSGDIDVNVGVIQYTYAIDLWGKAGGIMLVVPAGEVEGTLSLPGMELGSKSSGLGDVQLGFIYAITGVPYLTKETFASFNPGFTFGVGGRLMLDTGTYDANQPINLGTNRTAFQLMFPTAWYIGSSLVTPNLTSFELVPSVTFYGDNNKPFGASRLEQKPLYKLEGHITHNVNQAFWFSVDGLYQGGGETRTDGVSNHNSQSSFNLGATIAMNFSLALSAQLSWGETVSSNVDGLDGTMYRFKIQAVF
jgi:hypothetical protein